MSTQTDAPEAHDVSPVRDEVVELDVSRGDDDAHAALAQEPLDSILPR
jgi:hypothetical protein